MAQDKNLPKIETFIAKNTIVSGDIISTEGTIRIDGTVSGNLIKSHGIIIGEEGKLTANIEADIIIIAGKITGNIKCLQKLEVLPNAKIIGDIEAPILSLNEGCVFEGSCKMTQKTETLSKKEKEIENELNKLKGALE
jgi:cytoskeletal protein CcmA (bactofilin family)